MNPKLVLVTGATGLVGRPLALRLAAQGYRVQALVRSAAAADDLAQRGIELVVGDLAEPESLAPSLEQADVVVHAAAHIGDWGPPEDYRQINVVALDVMLNAVQRFGRIDRWVQISSMGVYPPRDHYGSDESTPISLKGCDGYTRTKAEAEIVLQRYMTQWRMPAVILRPGFIYGRGDRHVLPRLIDRLRRGTLKLVGDGRKLLNNTFVGNLVDAALLAIESDQALGEAFNIRDERLVDRVEFFQMICDRLDLPTPGRAPEWFARSIVGPVEAVAKLCGAESPPPVTRAGVKFMANNLDYSIGKAKSLLGYSPQIDFREGFAEALEGALESPSERQRDDVLATTSTSTPYAHRPTHGTTH